MLITNALVLSRHEYRDYDRMVTLLSPEHGRIDAAARGCRKPKSPLMNATECFCAGEFSLVETRGRYTLTGCQINESFYPLRTDYDRLIAGAYVLHLLLQAAMPDQPCEALFLTALKALAFLSYSQIPLALTTAAFEMHYMALTGQAPCVDRCARCGKPFTDQKARFDVRLGGAVCLHCPCTGQPLSHGARRILLKAPRTRFEAVEKLDGHPDWPEAARHIRQFVAERLDAPPRTWPDPPAG